MCRHVRTGGCSSHELHLSMLKVMKVSVCYVTLGMRGQEEITALLLTGGSETNGCARSAAHTP